MRIALLTTSAVALAIAGCEADRSNPNSSVGTSVEQANEVTVKIQSWEDTKKLVASHQGKIVVLDLWSTSCEPCMKEFPNLVALHQKYGNDKLVCISVSCDYEGIPGEPPESKKEAVLEFLSGSQASFTNILLSDNSEDVFEYAGIASIPAVFVYGTDGKLNKRFEVKSREDFTYEKDIIPLVEKLIED